MARKSKYFLVGLFVIVGVSLGVAAIIWIGVTGLLQQGELYVTYLDESVQGLQKDSAVKYRGVDVGRVESIRVAPDNRLIAVVMKINMRENLAQEAVAQLKAAGITGVMFIDLDRRRSDEPDMSPRVHFPSEYPIIPSRPSELGQILSGLQLIIDKLKQIDTEGIANSIKSVAQTAEGLLKGRDIKSILNKLEVAAANLQALTGKGDRILTGVNLQPLLQEAQATLKETHDLAATLKAGVESLRLAELGSKGRSTAGDIEAASANLKRSADTLEKLLERLYERPPDLFFGKPPPKRFNE